MNIIAYALATYGITAAISLLVVVVVIGVNAIMSNSGNGNN